MSKQEARRVTIIEELLAGRLTDENKARLTEKKVPQVAAGHIIQLDLTAGTFYNRL